MRIAFSTLLAVGLFAGSTDAANLDVRTYYTFDEVVDDDTSGGYTFNSTDYYADLSGNGNNAVLSKESTVTSDDPIGTTAKFGSSFRLAGSGDNAHTYTTTAHTADLNFTGNDDFTFSVWTHVDYTNAWQRGYYFGK